MTREEIEQIIRENIRTNGRGEITARVMAGVLESFVNYTDTQAEDFAELCRQLAAAFNALVVEMEGRFETKAEALEAAMEAFCSDLLNNHFIPWAEGLAGSLSDKMDLTKEAAEAARAAALEAKAGSILAAEKSTAAKAAIDSAADGIAEALLIIREGNKDEDIIKDGRTVVFFDYDGTVLYAYTPAELLAMEELPAAPEHDGLTAQGWNWTLAAAKAYVSKYPGAGLNIGMIYKPTDGKMHLTITLSASLTFSFEAISGSVDWGDGSDVEVVANGGAHTYAKPGKYEITIDGVTSIGRNAFNFRSALQSVTIPDSVTSIGNRAFSSCHSLRSVTIPDGVTSIGEDAFGFCTALQSVTIPDSVTSIGNYVFYECNALQSVTIPDGVTSIGESAFYSCRALQFVTIPDGVTIIGNDAFGYCVSPSVTIPDGVTSIGNRAFDGCYSLQVVCEALTPPTLGTSAFLQQDPVRIFVPDASVAAYKAATNWAAYADIIFPISEKF